MEKQYLEYCNACIKIYQDEIDFEAWQDYCKTIGAPLDAEYLIIYFNRIDADYGTTD